MGTLDSLSWSCLFCSPSVFCGSCLSSLLKSMRKECWTPISVTCFGFWVIWDHSLIFLQIYDDILIAIFLEGVLIFAKCVPSPCSHFSEFLWISFFNGPFYFRMRSLLFTKLGQVIRIEFINSVK
jgi:hypothetical protein